MTAEVPHLTGWLAEILCHNTDVVVQSTYEFGIESPLGTEENRP